MFNSGNKKSMQAFWDEVYTRKENPSWHQKEQSEINSVLDVLLLPTNASIFCAGIGDSELVDILLAKGYKNIVANDISSKALDKIKARLPNNQFVKYIVEDLMNPHSLLNYRRSIDLWIDRATLHFFTSVDEQLAYFNLVRTLLKPGGYFWVGVFSQQNTPVCSGLPLHLWSKEELVKALHGFELQDFFHSDFKQENGNNRNYLFALFRKNAVCSVE